VEDRLLPLEAMKCLLALAGDPAREGDGRVRVRRLAGEEIIRIKPAKHMLFSQTSRRRAADEDADLPASRGRWVQQFKFLRLSPEINYEPIIVALKGLQVFYKPGSFLTGAQFRREDAMREMFEELVRWGHAAEPLGSRESSCSWRPSAKGSCTSTAAGRGTRRPTSPIAWPASARAWRRSTPCSRTRNSGRLQLSFSPLAVPSDRG